MFCRISPVFLLLLLVFCQLCGQGHAVSSQQLQSTDEVKTISEFLKQEEKKIEKVLDLNGTEIEKSNVCIKKIESVFFGATKDVMFALAEVSDKEVQDENFNIFTKFYEIRGGDNWGKNAVKNKEDWNVQLAAKDLKKVNDPVIKSVVVVAKKDKIYHITMSNKKFDEPSGDTPAEWHVRLVEGNVINDTSKNKKTIKWEGPQISVLKKDTNPKNKLNAEPTKPLSCNSIGFVSGKKENIYFGMQCNSADSNNKNITAVFQLEESGKKKELKLLHVDDTKECHFSLFWWEEELVMTPTVCTTGGEKQKMMVFNLENNEFNESDRPISRLQEFLKNKKKFVTVKINDTEDVLLFTQKQSGKNDVYLWVTDGNRTAKIDVIINKITVKFDVSILYTNKELFVLHKQKKTGSDALDDTKYDLRRLPELLKKINLILNAWKATDNEIKTLFKKSVSTEAFLFTHGLVGFLSGGSGEKAEEWKDEYFYEDATVTGNGTRVEKGFRFSGEGAGAKWLVGKAIEDQSYNFADPGFTFVATVKIDNNANEKDNSVLGIEIKESTTNTKYNIGLWCNTDSKWAVSDGNNEKKILSANEKCVQGETYQVVLTMKNKDVSMYIDGKKMGELPPNLKTFQDPLNIAHFYFGADITTTGSSPVTDESHVTITNVLLYNRPFDEKKEINELKKYVTIKKDTKPPNGNTTPQESQEIPTPMPQDTDENEKSDEKEENAPSPSRTEDGGVGGGVRVFSLLLVVLCVSAPLLHL